MPVRGRFAPSPTGPLHLGSLVAAVGSWLFARAAGGEWIVRIEDLDRPRIVPDAEGAILRTLERFGLVWDGPVVRQSDRTALYVEALDRLRASGAVFDCACSRSDLARAASAPAAGDPDERIYPGTCRGGVPAGRIARAIRFRAPDRTIEFHDLTRGRTSENPARTTGDFVIRRADGIFAYQLAVVVDDAAQGVTQVVRGGDLLTSTARQIALYDALGLPVPEWAHLPLLLNPDGSKLSKRDGALPLPAVDERQVALSLCGALRHLGFASDPAPPARQLERALAEFDPSRIAALRAVNTRD